MTELSDDGNGCLVLELRGEVETGWHVTTSIALEQRRGVDMEGELSKADEGHFVQRLRLTRGAYAFKGYFRYVMCNDEMCLAPETVEFEYSGKASVWKKETVAEEAPQETVPVADSTMGAVIDSMPVKDRTLALMSSPLWNPVVREMKAREASDGLSVTNLDGHTLVGFLNIIFLGFIGGFLALLTPCVWPVIPLTVSFFLKRGRGVRDALLFGASIVVLFLLLGLCVTLLFGADAMNTLSTSAVFNVACFLVLLLFGFSLLGFFELRLPAKWGNNLDEMAENRTGVVSIFLMALTLVVVSFSCTAPVVGLLLVEVATQGDMLAPLLGLTSFALALALPFSLFALFPQWMQRLPRSGAWMNNAKVVLAVLELAFSLKFLSVADQSYGWGILSPTLFLVIWAVLFGSLAVYLLLKGLHSALCLVPLAFAVYLVQGVFTGHTAFVSAFMPVDMSARPEGARIFRDYDEGMRYAQKVGMPVFVDFTGYGCVNCRKMEGAVFTDDRVREKMQRDFVIIELYVDDRTPLPRQIDITDPTNGKPRTLRTVGDKWSLLERYKFGAQSQPLYVILSPDGNALSPSYGYDEDVDAFLRFLRHGEAMGVNGRR